MEKQNCPPDRLRMPGHYPWDTTPYQTYYTRRYIYAATQTRCQAHRAQDRAPDFAPQSWTFTPDRAPDGSTQVVATAWKSM